MRTQPADGGLAVFDLCGKNAVAAEPIIDARDGVAFFNIATAQWRRTVFAAILLAAAMHPDQHGQWAMIAAREVEVELVSLVPAFDIDEVAMGYDLV
jgi:hypothetical protein